MFWNVSLDGLKNDSIWNAPAVQVSRISPLATAGRRCDKPG